MSMRPFEYTNPITVDDVITLMESDGEGTIRPLAGGTDLLTLMKSEIATPSRLVNIKQIAELPRGIEDTDQGLRIGTLTTLTEIETNPLIQERYPVLAEAAAAAATPQLRNMATIGGNLLQRPRCWYFRSPQFQCWLKGGDECQARDGENQHHALFGDSPCVAVHPSDLAPALLALDAAVRLRGPSGERTVPLVEFFALPTPERRTENVLHSDELILSIIIPPSTEDTRSTYFKAMDRKVWAFALVGVAAVVRFGGASGRQIKDARIVLSGVANIPWRSTAAEEALTDAEPSEELIARVAEIALADAQPLEHNAYKVPLEKALVQRALESVLLEQG